MKNPPDPDLFMSTTTVLSEVSACCLGCTINFPVLGSNTRASLLDPALARCCSILAEFEDILELLVVRIDQ